MNKKSMKDGSYVALTRCFYCNEPDKIILHRNFKDISEFHDKVIDKEPCNKCKEYMKQGIIMVGVRDGESGENPYRTGEWHVVKEEAVKKMITPALFEQISKSRFTFVPQSALKAMGLPVSKEY